MSGHGAYTPESIAPGSVDAGNDSDYEQDHILEEFDKQQELYDRVEKMKEMRELLRRRDASAGKARSTSLVEAALSDNSSSEASDEADDIWRRRVA